MQYTFLTIHTINIHATMQQQIKVYRCSSKCFILEKWANEECDRHSHYELKHELKLHIHAFTHSQKSIYYRYRYSLPSHKYLYLISCMFREAYNAVLALIKSTDPSLMSAGFYVCREGRGCDRALISAITLHTGTNTRTHTVTHRFRFSSVG